jgi:hypothetical protein
MDRFGFSFMIMTERSHILCKNRPEWQHFGIVLWDKSGLEPRTCTSTNNLVPKHHLLKAYTGNGVDAPHRYSSVSQLVGHEVTKYECPLKAIH